MQLTRAFSIARGADDDWFDTLLNHDTRLFIDPFLVFRDTEPTWANAHADIVRHFERAFLLVAQAHGQRESLAYRKALGMLEFREPRELCLGFTAEGTDGLGSGAGFARLMAQAMEEAIARGLDNPDHFEELGVLQKGISRDRIGDIAATILKPRLIAYTQEVAARHQLPTTRHRVYGALFEPRRQRFLSERVELPTNPVTKGPLPLVPERFLRELPTLNAEDFWRFYESERLREDLNYQIATNVDKATIVRAARGAPDVVRGWLAEREARAPADPYDVQADPSTVYQWQPAGERFATNHPLVIDPVTTEAGFQDVIDRIVAQYKLYIEETRGWRLLWEDVPQRRENLEEAAQLAFRGLAHPYCVANDISLDREVDLGRGKVDFKLSRGHQLRAHLEIKKLHSGSFWRNFENQLPTYLKADEVRHGWFVAVIYRDPSKAMQERLRTLPTVVHEAAAHRGANLRLVVVDARPKASASNV